MTLRILAGKFKGRLLKTPKGKTTRPTQGVLREAVFNICQDRIEKAHFLDLCAGSGSMGFEALSRGAARVVFVEHAPLAVRCLRETISLLQVSSQAEVLACNLKRALKELAHQSASFDIIYLDPPYRAPLLPLLEEVFSYSSLFMPEALLFAEESCTNRSLPSFPHLSYLGARRFGSTLLHQFSS